MKFRHKLKPWEQEIVDLNSDKTILILYYPKPAKIHRARLSSFRIKKGYALVFSNKILRKFKNCEISSVKEFKEDGSVISYPSIKHAIVGGDYK